MTTDEAYAEMKKRGWGFARSNVMIAVGPILNTDWKEKNEPPMIEVYAMGSDPVAVVQAALNLEAMRSNGTPR